MSNFFQRPDHGYVAQAPVDADGKINIEIIESHISRINPFPTIVQEASNIPRFLIPDFHAKLDERHFNENHKQSQLS